MTETANVLEDQSPPKISLPMRILALLPGIALLLAIGYAGKRLEGLIASPKIEYVLWAILIGSVIGNTLGGMRWFKVFAPGIATYEFWLKLGIVLLGVRFMLADLVKLGGTTLVLIGIELVASIALMIVIGRLFGLGEKLTALLAIGSSICGVSAIIAAEGAIDADEKDTSYAIAAILALGAISLFTYPSIGRALHMSPIAYGTWTGLSVDNTAEALAVGKMYLPLENDLVSNGDGKTPEATRKKLVDEAFKRASVTKTTRNATIGFVVLGAAMFFSMREGRKFHGSKIAFLWKTFPKFVLGFLLFSTLASCAFFTKAQIGSLGDLSKWVFVLTFAGVGLRTNIYELFQQGVRPFMVGAVGELFIAALTLVLVLGADRWVGL